MMLESELHPEQETAPEAVRETIPEEPTQEAPRPEKKKTHKRTGLKITALVLCCSLLSGAIGAGSALIFGGRDQKETASTTVQMGVRENTVVDIAHIDTSKEMTASEVYAENVNSTVGITTSITTNFWGYQTTSAASGSGFILTSDGYILTNYHVIEDSSSITVTLYDGTAYDASVVGYDENSDIAVLKVEAEGLSPVVIGDSDNLNVGDSVVAIGNPLGELTFSLTAGAVSALNREVTMSSGVTMDLIQTDCAINSGNSGGALFNMYGEVIGITNAKYSGSGSMGTASIDNIGFAIPINQVNDTVRSIIENGYYAKPYIGVSVTSVGEESLSYGLPEGAAVKAVTEDSPAAAAGLQVNDIITDVNGTAITSSDELVDVVRAAAAGDKLTMTVYRQGETVELTVEVGEQIQSALPEPEEQSQDNSQQGQQMFPWGFGNN